MAVTSASSFIFMLCLFIFTISHEFRPTAAQDSFPTFTEESCNNLPTLVCMLTSIIPQTGNKPVQGTIYFSPIWQTINDSTDQQTCYTRIQGEFVNLKPNNQHGFHVHTYGDMTVDDGTGAAGHFTSPGNSTRHQKHGYPNDIERHWGDFGNITATASGTASYERVDKVIRLGGILGRAVIVHAENDKGPSEQPSGASGARIAHGVIGFANPTLLEDDQN